MRSTLRKRVRAIIGTSTSGEPSWRASIERRSGRTSVLSGAFAELLTGDAPIVLNGPRRILYWGSADQPLDFTAKDDVAEYVASVAIDADAPRILRIAGTTVSPRELAAIMTELTGKKFGFLRPGGMRRLSAVIWIVRALTPRNDAVFPVWQGMQYMRDLSSGRGKLDPLDNDRYGIRKWTSAREVLSAAS